MGFPCSKIRAGRPVGEPVRAVLKVEIASTTVVPRNLRATHATPGGSTGSEFRSGLGAALIDSYPLERDQQNDLAACMRMSVQSGATVELRRGQSDSGFGVAAESFTNKRMFDHAKPFNIR